MPSPWGEAARIFRRIALLRASGQDEEAEAILSRDLAAALEAARASEASTEAADRRQTALFSLEERRMVHAASLAELLAPILAAHLRGVPDSPPVGQPDRHAAPRPPAGPGSGRRAPSRPADIADMIDGMIALETAERREGAARPIPLNFPHTRSIQPNENVPIPSP